MKRNIVIKGIAGLFLLCLLVGGGLRGYRYEQEKTWKKEQKERFWELIDQFNEIKSEDFVDYPLEGSDIEQQMEVKDFYKRIYESTEYKSWNDTFLEYIEEAKKDTCISEQWAQLFLSDKLNDTKKSWLTSTGGFYSSISPSKKDLECLLPVLDSDQVPNIVKLNTIERLESPQNYDTLIDYKLQLIHQATNLKECLQAMESLEHGQNPRDGEQITSLSVAEDTLAKPEKYQEYQVLAAAFTLTGFGDSKLINTLDSERKKQISKLLHNAYEKTLHQREVYWGYHETILDILLTMESDKTYEWLLELLHKYQKDTSLKSWEVVQTIQGNFHRQIERMYLNMKENPKAERIVYVLEVLNSMTTLQQIADMELAGSNIQIDAIWLSMQEFLQTYPNREQLPILSKEMEIGEEKGFYCEKDIDRDGLVDTEKFIAWNGVDQGSYELTFGNGDHLFYAFPAQIWNTYQMKLTDLNGDGSEEIILFLDMDPRTLNYYGVDMVEIPPGKTKTCSTLIENSAKGLMVFTKPEGSQEYTLVKTKDGTAMITDIYNENGELAYKKNWLEELGEF